MGHTLTLVTPSFNQGKFIEETLSSVVAQREHIHEYFVVDGGSTDETISHIERHEKYIDWWVSESDRGQADAIHKGFAKATGSLIGWLNSDDLILPGAIPEVLSTFDRYPSCDVVSGYLALIDEDSKVISLPRVPSGNSLLARGGLIQVSQQASFFKKSLYEKVGGLDIDLHCAMDMDLWARFYLNMTAWKHIPSFLAAFRKHSEAKGSGNSWWDNYQREKAIIRSRYPDLYGGKSPGMLVKMVYRFGQVASGRQMLSNILTARYQGKTITSVFPPPDQ